MSLLGPSLAITDQMIDKHFDKIPNKVFSRDTYKPRSRRKSRRGSEQDQQDQQGSNSSSDSEDVPARGTGRGRRDRSNRRSDRDPVPVVEEYDDMQDSHYDIPRYSGQAGRGQDYTYGAGSTSQQFDYSPSGPIYSHDPPRLRPQYVPTPPPGQDYRSPGGGYASSQPTRDRGRYDSDDNYSSDTQHSSRRRPKIVTRRSSSYHGPRDRRDYNNSYGANSGGKQLQRRRGSEAGAIAKVKDIEHRYGLKEEVNEVLTTSKAGLTGGAIGAVVGGWAANKAQIAYGKEKPGERHEGSNPMLTLLGAAAGGLAVDALVAMYEDKKKETGVKEKKWEKKFGDEKGENGRGSDSGRRSRRRRDSYDSN